MSKYNSNFIYSMLYRTNVLKLATAVYLWARNIYIIKALPRILNRQVHGILGDF